MKKSRILLFVVCLAVALTAVGCGAAGLTQNMFPDYTYQNPELIDPDEWNTAEYDDTMKVDGVLDEGVLVLLRDFHEKRTQSMKKCASCGEISPPETKFCLFCGTRFPNENTAG